MITNPGRWPRSKSTVGRASCLVAAYFRFDHDQDVFTPPAFTIRSFICQHASVLGIYAPAAPTVCLTLLITCSICSSQLRSPDALCLHVEHKPQAQRAPNRQLGYHQAEYGHCLICFRTSGMTLVLRHYPLRVDNTQRLPK